MLIILLLILIGSSWAIENVEITEPVDGETYDGDWLTVRAIVENDNELPDSVHRTLNGAPFILIPRLNTDWYTYMQNDLRHGYSASPAPYDNTVFWTAPVTGMYHEFCTPVIYDGVVYFLADNTPGIQDDSIWALDAATGAVIWADSVYGETDDPVVVDGTFLYYNSRPTNCCNRFTGQLTWSFEHPGDGHMSGTPIVSEGAVFTVCEADTVVVYSLDASTGDEIWSTALNGEWSMQSCYTLHSGSLIVPCYTGSLYSLDASDGSIQWVNSDALGGYWDSSPTIVDNVIYIGGIDDDSLRAIDASTGSTVWHAHLGSITATPAYHDGALYVGAQGAPFCSVNAVNGVFNWNEPLRIHGSPAVADGLVFFGEYSFNDSARVISLDCATGDTMWTYMTTANRFQGSPAVTDGIVYIPAIDGNLYAFGTGLKYTYLDDLFAQVGANELIVTSFDEGVAVTADTINFTVTGTGIHLEPSVHDLCTSPNPFSSNLSISYSLQGPSEVNLSVYDLSGRLIEDLLSHPVSEGDHTIIWNPDPVLPNGCYLIVLDACGERAVRRCVKLD